MKRSNLLFIILITTIFLIPLIVFAISVLLPGEKCYMGFNERFQVISINNPDLKASDVQVNSKPAFTYFPPDNLGEEEEQNKAYLYYKGDQPYLPELSDNIDTLLVGKPLDAGKDTKLSLCIHMNNIHSILLNGECIWSKQNEDK